MRFRIGILFNRMWSIGWDHPREWFNSEDKKLRRAWYFLCHWPKYDDYWLRILGLTISGRKGLADMARRGPRSCSEHIEQGISVFQLTDYEWFAATDRDSAIACALEMWGMTIDEARDSLLDDPSPCNLDVDKLNIDPDMDPDGESITFREQLRRLIAEDCVFPCFFSGVDA